MEMAGVFVILKTAPKGKYTFSIQRTIMEYAVIRWLSGIRIHATAQQGKKSIIITMFNVKPVYKRRRLLWD
jgi:hypothetical protein